MEAVDAINEIPVAASAPAIAPDAEVTPAPWELVDTGRYRPRRIRGSCRGRELG